jgi:hypothetical protein
MQNLISTQTLSLNFVSILDPNQACKDENSQYETTIKSKGMANTPQVRGNY